MERQYTEIGKLNDRLEILGYELIALISEGASENVDDLISQMGDSNLVHYIVNKYGDRMATLSLNDSLPYDLDEWEKVFEQYSYLTFGHDVNRKMGIRNREKDGLLMLVEIILEEIADRRYK